MAAEDFPSVMIKPSADEANRQLLLDFETAARELPEDVDEALEVYAMHPEAVARMVDILSKKPERLPLLSLVVKVMEDEADYDLDVPDRVLDEIKQEPLFAELQASSAHADSPEAKRSATAKLRGFWLKRSIERLAA